VAHILDLANVSAAAIDDDSQVTANQGQEISA
jgi:hypothetical protein